MRTVTFIASALLLAACGGGGKDKAPPVAEQPPAPVPAPAPADRFVTVLAAIVNTRSDDAEPGSVDTLVATMPEDTEPAPLGP